MDINNRLGKREAEGLVRELLDAKNAPYASSKHAKQEMEKDDLTINDVLNILRRGRIKEITHSEGVRKYEVRTEKITVIFKFTYFDKALGLKVITCWRNDVKANKKK